MNQPLRSIRLLRKIFEQRSASSRINACAAFFGHHITCTKSKMCAIVCSFLRAERSCWKAILKRCRASTAWTRWKNSSLRWHASDSQPDQRDRSTAPLSRERQSRACAAVVCLGCHRYGSLGIHHEIPECCQRGGVRFRAHLSWSCPPLGFLHARYAWCDDGLHGRRMVAKFPQYLCYAALDLGICKWACPVEHRYEFCGSCGNAGSGHHHFWLVVPGVRVRPNSISARAFSF